MAGSVRKSRVMQKLRLATRALLAIVLAAPIARGDALTDALARKDYRAAAVLLERAVAAQPERSGAAYNLACVYASLGQREKAVNALEIAAARGFFFTATLLRDPDLDPLRDLPGYAAALAKIRANNAAQLATFRAKAEPAARVLVFPPAGLDPKKPAPLVVALHGSGGTAESFAPVFRDAASRLGAVLAVPEGLNPSGRGFDWGVVEQGTHLVLRAIEKAKERYAIDPERVVLAGFSNGASQAFLLALQRPELFRGVVPIAGFYEERVAPVPSGAPRLPRFAILNGALDEAADNNRAGARALEARGGAVRLRLYPGVGHALPPDREKELVAALKFALGEREVEP